MGHQVLYQASSILYYYFISTLVFVYSSKPTGWNARILLIGQASYLNGYRVDLKLLTVSYNPC